MSFEVSVRAKLAAAFDKGTLKLTSWIRLLYGLRLSCPDCTDCTDCQNLCCCCCCCWRSLVT